MFEGVFIYLVYQVGAALECRGFCVDNIMALVRYIDGNEKGATHKINMNLDDFACLERVYGQNR